MLRHSTFLYLREIVASDHDLLGNQSLTIFLTRRPKVRFDPKSGGQEARRPKLRFDPKAGGQEAVTKRTATNISNKKEDDGIRSWDLWANALEVALWNL